MPTPSKNTPDESNQSPPLSFGLAGLGLACIAALLDAAYLYSYHRDNGGAETQNLMQFFLSGAFFCGISAIILGVWLLRRANELAQHNAQSMYYRLKAARWLAMSQIALGGIAALTSAGAVIYFMYIVWNAFRSGFVGHI